MTAVTVSVVSDHLLLLQMDFVTIQGELYSKLEDLQASKEAHKAMPSSA